MTLFGLINFGVTLVLAMFVMGSTLCRITQIDMKRVRYRYVLPILMLFCWSTSVFFTMIGGDTPDWFQPLALLALAVYLFNNRDDWLGGMPQHMLKSDYYQKNLNKDVFVMRRVSFENVVVSLLAIVTIGATAAGAMDGRGEPLQIYSAQADPPVTTPNGTIKIVYSFRRVRVCAGYVDRFVLNSAGVVEQKFGTTPVGAGEIGKKLDNVAVTLKLVDLVPGQKIYRAVIYHNCADDKYVTRSPDVPFVVSPDPVQ